MNDFNGLEGQKGAYVTGLSARLPQPISNTPAPRRRLGPGLLERGELPIWRPMTRVAVLNYIHG